VVIIEHSTETLAPMHRLRWRDDRGGPQELVCEALMIAFSMVVRHEVGNRVLERGLSEEDHVHLDAQEIGRCQAFPVGSLTIECAGLSQGPARCRVLGGC
jgi:hypothetical protein